MDDTEYWSIIAKMSPSFSRDEFQKQVDLTNGTQFNLTYYSNVEDAMRGE